MKRTDDDLYIVRWEKDGKPQISQPLNMTTAYSCADLCNRKAPGSHRVVPWVAPGEGVEHPIDRDYR